MNFGYMAMSALLGHWTTGFRTDAPGMVQSRVTFDFSETEVTGVFDLMVHTPQADGAYEAVRRGTYALGGPAAGVAGANDFDIDFTRTLLTPLHPTTVRDFNADKECGLDGWQAGVQRDVTGRYCDSTGVQQFSHGTLYTIIQVLPDVSIQYGDIPDDSHLGYDPAHRPRALDPQLIIPRNGQGGAIPPDPDDQDPHLAGIYAASGYRVNPSGCDLGAATPATAAPFVEIYANSDVMPYFPGWSSLPCATPKACKDQGKQVNLGGEFVIHSKAGDDQFYGTYDQTLWTDHCHATVTMTTVARGAGDGRLQLTSKVYEGDPAGIPDEAHCRTDGGAIDRQAPAFACIHSAMMTATPVTTTEISQ